MLEENHIPKETGIVQKGHSNPAPSFVPSKSALEAKKKMLKIFLFNSITFL